LIVFVAYQMMFAQITPALITGAFANRVTFKAYLLFLVAWLMLVYFPVAHMVWGGGILQAHGVLVFAGGIVVHATAGFAALAAVFYVGKRRVADAGLHSIPLVALGTGLLWFGWYGFNAGSELKVDSVTALAFLNTDVAASFAAITWLALAWVYEKKPKLVGLLTGSIAGLAAVTPAAGYVSTATAILIGIVASVVCYYAIFLKNRMGWDDALDVWGVHGVGGVVGVISLGLFAFKAMNPDGGADGLMHGGSSFFIKESGAAIGAALYAFIFTYVMLAVINKITPVTVTAADEELGLDESLHGERAYI
jgi:Amt family ammonium transporter